MKSLDGLNMQATSILSVKFITAYWNIIYWDEALRRLEGLQCANRKERHFDVQYTESH
jgi:hypothetical protein